MTTLKTYMVGENDMALATSPEEAKQLVLKESLNDERMLELEVTEVDGSFELTDEEGNFDQYLHDFVKGLTEPQYLFGWE